MRSKRETEQRRKIGEDLRTQKDSIGPGYSRNNFAQRIKVDLKRRQSQAAMVRKTMRVANDTLRSTSGSSTQETGSLMG